MYTRLSPGTNPSFVGAALVVLGGTMPPFCVLQNTLVKQKFDGTCI